MDVSRGRGVGHVDDAQTVASADARSGASHRGREKDHRVGAAASEGGRREGARTVELGWWSLIGRSESLIRELRLFPI